MLYGQTVAYLGMISRGELTTEQNDQFMRLMDAVNNLESIGDAIETDLVSLGRKLIGENVRVSPATQRVLLEIQRATLGSVHAAVEAVSRGSDTEAREVMGMKADINALVESASLHEARRLVAEEPNRIAAYTIEMDIIEKLKRIYHFAKRMAKTVSPLDSGADQVGESE